MRNRRVFTGALRSQVWSAGFGVFGSGIRRAVPNAVTMAKRSIVDVSAYHSTYDCLKDQKQLSPITGALFVDSGALLRFYQYAAAEHKPTAVGKLVLAMFYKNGEEFRHTQNKSNPAYSLTPELLAKLIHHLNKGTLANVEVREKIKEEWRAHHAEVTGGRVTAGKVDALIDLMIAAFEECQNKIFPEELVNTIFMSYLHMKVTTRKELICYLRELFKLDPEQKHGRALDEIDEMDDWHRKLGLEALAKMMEKRANEKFIENLLAENFETIAFALLKSRQRLPKVAASQYGFNGKPPRANCAEVAYHNFVNILLHDCMNESFNFRLLPATLKPNEKLLELYENGKLKFGELNSRNIGQGFMDILSGKKNIIYVSNQYEVETTVDNFIPIMNLLFGSTATTFAELSTQFSDSRREIIFKKIDESTVEINIISGLSEEVKFKFSNYHAELLANRFDCKNDHEKANEKFVERVTMNSAIHAPLLSLIDSSEAITESMRNRLALQDFTVSKQMMIYQRLMAYLAIGVDGDTYYVANILAECDHDNNVYAENYLHYLLKKKPEIVFSAVMQGNERCMERLMRLDPSVIDFRDTSESTLLHKAVYHQRYGAARVLLAAGANVNATNDVGETPLFFANESSMVDFLVDAGADIHVQNNYDDTAAHSAAAYRDAATLKKLINSGANINVKGGDQETVFHRAVRKGCIDAVYFMIRAGGDLNTTNIYGDTPLHAAAKRSDIDILTMLVEHGANIHAKNISGITPLHYAAESGDIFALLKLIHAGADVDSLNNNLSTPLHFAANNSKMATIHSLIQSGAAVDAVNASGTTPFHIAAYQGCGRAIHALLAAGAKADRIDKKGQTALHYLMKGVLINGRILLDDVVDIIEQLLKAGVDLAALDQEGRSALDIFEEAVEARQRDGNSQMAYIMRIKSLLEGSDHDPVCDAMSGIDEERSNVRRLV